MLDNFKKQDEQQQMDISQIPIIETGDNASADQQPEELQDQSETGDQMIQQAMETEHSQGVDATLRSMMRDKTPENIEFPADLRDIKRPKSFNKKKGIKDKKISAPEYNAPIQIQQDSASMEIDVDPELQDQENQYQAPI